MNLKKRILVAPLNWGLGHATRCIPIINALIEHDFEPIIASDGKALLLLKKEFPQLQFIKLPSYNISYPKNGKNFKWHFAKSLPKLLKVIREERRVIELTVECFKIQGIINDNRFGVYHKSLPSVYVTHQLNVLSGNTTSLTSKMHQYIINKFDECWIPDIDNNLSGKLGHSNHLNIPIKYLSILSRFSKIKTEIKYDLLVLLSGPEPQRSNLEKHLINELKNYNGNVLFIKGKVEKIQQVTKVSNITFINFMQSNELETAINQSKLILSRSGYTTILDLAKLNKKAYFIPTPGQFEQEFLAKRLEEKGIIPFSSEDDFKVEHLEKISNYSGFIGYNKIPDFENLFSLFKGK